MDAAGGDLRRLTFHSGVDAFASWSPDGARLAFASDRAGAANSDVWVMDADGSHAERLTDHPLIDTFPAWSPDGTRIAFSSGRDIDSDLYVMDADGSNERRLTTAIGVDTQQAWSPDSSELVFASGRGGQTDLYAIHADGSGERQLTNDAASEGWPSWSPDGASIAFASNASGRPEIYVMDVTGGAPRRLTEDGGDHPRWSPDGSLLTFVSARTGNTEIYTMAADGTGERRLTDAGTADDTNPAFGPSTGTADDGRTWPGGVTGPVGNAGRWLVDSSGRVVLLRGVNLTPVMPGMDPIQFGFGEDDAAFLKRQGFNVVRLGMTPELIEPEFGNFDDVYLGRLERVVELLGDHGIYVVLDMHQDLYSRFLSHAGRGFPEWAVQDDGLPHEPDAGFPGSYFVEPAVNRAFDHFWANDPGPAGRGLQDELGDGWRHVAERFRSDPHVLGYDLLNEPWPGSQWPSCVNPVGCPMFDTGPLSDFFDRVIAAIREADTQKLVWYQPNPTFNAGAATHLRGTDDERSGMAFHVYCEFGGLRTEEDCRELVSLAFDNAESHSRQTGAPLMVGEFGPVERESEARDVLAEADEHILSWQYWDYWGTSGQPYPCCPETHRQPPWSVLEDPAKPPVAGNLHQATLDLIVRPYPQAIAGTPTYVHFDAKTRAFALEYTTAAPAGAAAARASTDVFLPRRVYPDGYELEVRGARVHSPRGAEMVRLKAHPGTDEVSLSVTPTG